MRYYLIKAVFPLRFLSKNLKIKVYNSITILLQMNLRHEIFLSYLDEVKYLRMLFQGEYLDATEMKKEMGKLYNA